MKKLHSLATGFLMLFCFSTGTFAQIGTPGGGGETDPGGGGTGCDESCLNGTLNISTGYVQSTGTWNTPLATESNWTLISVPPAAVPLLGTGPYSAYDISPHPAWASFPNATWVSAYQYANHTPNNCPPDAPFTFQKCFCVCRDATLNFDFEMLVDDGANIYLDGTLIASAMAGWQFQWANRLIFNQSFPVTAGQHCLTVELHNCGGVAMGFAIEGEITGFDLLRPECCTPTASICGTKVFDSNCDGHVDPTIDPGLAGWTIELYDAANNLIATTVTSGTGDYCFTGLAPGTYTVAEVNQPGWTQTFPGAPGTHTITVLSGDVGTAVFANCRNSPPPCNVYADFNILNIKDCQISLQALYPVIPPGSQLISTYWTFGDGQSSYDPNPIHYYAAPGNYNVCLTVTIFNGEECCSKTYCQNVHIDKGCDNGCDFDASIGVVFDGSICNYTFTSNIAWAGLPVTSVFWDFGDGTYGHGTTINHQFPAPGAYVVCMYLFSNTPDGECCFRKFCVDVVVRCTPCGEKGSADGTMKNAPADKNAPVNVLLNDKNIIVLKQNVPNPFAESTTIHYNISTEFTRAQMIFTNIDGKIIKTVDINRKGEGQLNVFSDDLSTGTYVYTLVVDGKTIESKRMVKK